MKTKKLNVYNTKVNTGVDNCYPTPDDAFKQPCLHYIVGQRTSGKSYLTSLILAQAEKDKTFDVIYIVTPSFNSNKAYFGKYILEENVFEPTKHSVNDIITLVEQDRDEWEEFIVEKEMYRKFLIEMDKDKQMKEEDLLDYYYLKFLHGYIPKWKYAKPEPPKSLLILDDVLGSNALKRSSGLTQVATLNRHIAPLKEDYKGRSACGLALMILCQTYKMQDGVGRCLRENVSLLTLFKNKQKKQMDSIREELANVIDEEIFDTVYNYCTDEPFGNLTLDFTPKDPKYRFRKNLNELVLIDSSLNIQKN